MASSFSWKVSFIIRSSACWSVISHGLEPDVEDGVRQGAHGLLQKAEPKLLTIVE